MLDTSHFNWSLYVELYPDSICFIFDFYRCNPDFNLYVGSVFPGSACHVNPTLTSFLGLVWLEQ